MDTKGNRTMRLLLAGAVLAMAIMACSLTGGQPTDAPATESPAQTAPPAASATTEATSPPDASATPTTRPTASATSIPPSPTAPPTTVARVEVPSQVRRLNAAVFTGARQPLPALDQDGFITLDANALITTDLNGEAEVVLNNCLRIFVFQLSSLTRSTCRRADQQSGLAACSTGGIATVINNCTSKVKIESPSASVTTDGTMFSLIYLPEDQISLLQVYEGEVDVQGVTDMSSGQMSGGSTVEQDNLWFSAPGSQWDNINGIPAREAQEMSVWEAIRPELIVRYPYLDTWMDSTGEVIRAQNLDFQSYLDKPNGTVQMGAVGPAFDEPNENVMLTQGVWWSDVEHSVWPDQNVRLTLTTPLETVEDARILEYNQEAAQGLVTSTSFQDFDYVIWIALDGNDPYSSLEYVKLSDYFQQLGLNPEPSYYYDNDSLQALIAASETGDNPPLFWVGTTPEWVN